jgi:hypothetical protein
VFGFAASAGYAGYALLEHFTRKSGEMFWIAVDSTGAVETAVRCLDLLGIKAGQTMLINGAATQFAGRVARR